MTSLFSRRDLLGALTAGATLAIVRPAAAREPSPPVESTEGLFQRARHELARVGGSVPLQDVVGIADYSHPSSAPRFHLVDMASGQVTSLLVSHGRGSDPLHSGWVQRFSNDPGSYASSEGAYVTGDLYAGKHGRSMRLSGLDSTNSNAERRAIVVHSAWYVSPAMIHDHGQLGRSEGCFAFSESDLDVVLHRLGAGRLLLSTKV
jgi:L,D-transpeptidase catalytic domain